MNQVMREIRQYMHEMAEDADGWVTALFTFPHEFIGFRGHFPGNPILPGLCEIQAVMVMLQERKKSEANIREISMAKFISPISTNEEVVFKCRERTDGDGSTSVTALAFSKGRKVAEFRLKVNVEMESRIEKA